MRVSRNLMIVLMTVFKLLPLQMAIIIEEGIPFILFSALNIFSHISTKFLS